MADVTSHLAFPLRVVGGRFRSVEQGSPRHLQDQADVLLRTRPGTIEHAPELGLRDLVARVGPASPEILAAISRHVPGEFTAREDESELAARVRRVAVAVVREDREA